MSVKEALYAPIEDIKSRIGRGGNYEYVTWQDVADRMNEVFGINWSSEVMSQDVLGSNVIVRVKVTVFDEASGAFFKQEGFGGAPNDERAEAGNPYKAAYSKALKDACKRWGVGLHLEDDSPSNTGNGTPPGFAGREFAQPSAMPSAPIPGPAPTSAAPVVETPTTATPVAPQAPSSATPPPVTPASTSGMPVPPGVSMSVTSDVAVQQQEEPTPEPVPVAAPTVPPAPVAPAMPSTPAPAAVSAPPVSTPPTPQAPPAMPATPAPMGAKVPPIATEGLDGISDVQKAALQSILKIKDVNYETLAAEAFAANGVDKTPPAQDDLSYQEAVYVVKYGNDKFRKR